MKVSLHQARSPVSKEKREEVASRHMLPLRGGIQTHATPEQLSLPLVQTSCPLLRPPHFLLLSSTAAVTAAVRAGQGEKRDIKVSPFQGSYRQDRGDQK